MTDDDDEFCPQCGQVFVDGVPVAQFQAQCDGCEEWHVLAILHYPICYEDYQADRPVAYTQNRMAGLRRLN